ncbi:MAG: zinc ribbon domain-containing protein [Kiritimatiellae bacterium]|nr:zinc ribbon domain-containing protein [Kiritimatiellia bacterium]
MPIYEYKCKKCGKTFEHLARSLSEPAPKCPQCGASRPEKQFSAFSAGTGGGRSDSFACPGGACPTGACPTGTCPSGTCPLG